MITVTTIAVLTRREEAPILSDEIAFTLCGEKHYVFLKTHVTGARSVLLAGKSQSPSGTAFAPAERQATARMASGFTPLVTVRKEKTMSGRIAVLVLSGTLAGVGIAFAQDSTPGAGVVEVTYMPAGAAFITSKDDAPGFGNYGFGTAVSFNVNHHVGIEGELGSMLSTTSNLQFGDLDSDTKAPNFLSYTANVVVTPWTGHSVQPYGTGGVGGLTMFERPGVGVFNDETFLTGNVGGGVKWYAPNNRWGLRGDYRFAATRSKDDAPAFFGSETRYVHRVYGAVVINTVR